MAQRQSINGILKAVGFLEEQANFFKTSFFSEHEGWDLPEDEPHYNELIATAQELRAMAGQA